MIIGLGWKSLGDVDFDASIISLDKDRNFLRVCNFMNDRICGMQHRGDDISGKGDGDDERMRIDFDKVPLDTKELYVCVNIYSSGTTFKDVRQAYIRVCIAE